jgi:DGQHR domain-containing protein
MQLGLARKRLGELSDYLVNAPDHFFSALTLILLPRDLSRASVEGEKDSDEEWDYFWDPYETTTPAPNRRRVGTLWLSGDARLFPADGQHRARSAKEAMKLKPGIAREEVPVVFVPYAGTGQVRQLFSDLNLNAKVVSKTVGYDFSLRDPTALLAKAMMEKVDLFDARVNRNSNSLPKSSSNVISLNTLVQGCRSIAEALANTSTTDEPPPVEKYLASHPEAADKVAAVWNVIIDAFEPFWQPVIDGDEQPGALRQQYVFPHGMGWTAIAQAAGRLIETDEQNWPTRLRRAVTAIDWRRDAEIWDGPVVVHNPSLVADPEGRINNTGPGVSALRDIVLDHAAG